MTHARRFLTGVATPLRAVALALALLLAASVPAAAASRPASQPGLSTEWPGHYLLSLGDSLAFGYQSARVDAELRAGTYSPDHFPGYVVPLAEQLRQLTGEPRTVVNYGCPGETTTSMVAGPCGYAVSVHQEGYPRALHDDYAGSQLAAAVAFLRSHRGEVSPITVSIGANDLNNLFNSCSRDVTCVQQGLPATLATLAANLGVTLDALRAQAPQAQIIVLTPYNPAYVINPATDALVTVTNAVIAAVTRAGQARVGDGFAAINQAIPGQELASVCTFTLMCPVTPGSSPDIHPSDAGYLRLADAFLTASDRVTGRRAA
jgi:lysophospholipase L1-like esterase